MTRLRRPVNNDAAAPRAGGALDHALALKSVMRPMLAHSNDGGLV